MESAQRPGVDNFVKTHGRTEAGLVKWLGHSWGHHKFTFVGAQKAVGTAVAGGPAERVWGRRVVTT